MPAYVRFWVATAVTVLTVAVASLWPTALAVVPGANGKIVFIGSDGVSRDVYTMNADGSNVTNLTNDGRNNDQPEWSPDGSRIAWDTWAQFNNGNVWVMNADGSAKAALTKNVATDHVSNSQPTWTPNGSSIVFVRSDDAAGAEIYRMAADGSNPTRLTNTSAEADDVQPAVSPNGTIAFASDRANTPYEMFDIYVMNADGSGVRRLTFDGGDPEQPTEPMHDSLNPAWSPDGTRVAFDTTRDGNREVYVINANGSGLVNVSQHTASDYAPTWSPDGSQLTFTSTRAGQADIWAVDVASFSGSTARVTAAATSSPRNLTATLGIPARTPSWQPVGTTTACTIVGTARAERLEGTAGADTICGGGGNDTIIAAGGADTLRGGAGADVLQGQGGSDELVGGGGLDRLFGGYGTDTLRARDGVGGETVDGGPGTDDCQRDSTDTSTSCP